MFRLFRALFLISLLGAAACAELDRVPTQTEATAHKATFRGQVRAPRKLLGLDYVQAESYPLQETTVNFAVVTLTDGAGNKVPGVDPVHTDGAGNYVITDAMLGSPYILSCSFGLASGRSVTMRAIGKAIEPVNVVDITTHAALVTAYATNKLPGLVTNFNPETFQRATEVVAINLTNTSLPNLEDREAMVRTVAQWVEINPALKETLALLREELRRPPATPTPGPSPSSSGSTAPGEPAATASASGAPSASTSAGTTPSPSPSASRSPSPSPSASAGATPTPRPSPTPTPTPRPTPTPTPTPTPRPTPTPVPTPTPMPVTTLAGNGAPDFVNAVGTGARFKYPTGLAVDAAGVIYVADSENHRIRRVLPTGAVESFAGTGVSGAANGDRASATFNTPTAVAVDGDGNVFVADQLNHVVRRIASTGEVTTYGTGFSFPNGVAVDGDGNVYVADTGNHAIKQIAPTGGVTTILSAANGLNQPHGVAVDGARNVYVADTGSNRVRKRLASNNSVTVVSGTFNRPTGVAVDGSGRLYVADHHGHKIHASLGASATVYAGNGTAGFSDGSRENAQFRYPRGVAAGPNGVVYVADERNHRIRKIQ